MLAGVPQKAGRFEFLPAVRDGDEGTWQINHFHGGGDLAGSELWRKQSHRDIINSKNGIWVRLP